MLHVQNQYHFFLLLQERTLTLCIRDVLRGVRPDRWSRFRYTVARATYWLLR